MNRGRAHHLEARGSRIDTWTERGSRSENKANDRKQDLWQRRQVSTTRTLSLFFPPSSASLVCRLWRASHVRHTTSKILVKVLLSRNAIKYTRVHPDSTIRGYIRYEYRIMNHNINPAKMRVTQRMWRVSLWMKTKTILIQQSAVNTMHTSCRFVDRITISNLAATLMMIRLREFRQICR